MAGSGFSKDFREVIYCWLENRRPSLAFQAATRWFPWADLFKPMLLGYIQPSSMARAMISGYPMDARNLKLKPEIDIKQQVSWLRFGLPSCGNR